MANVITNNLPQQFTTESIIVVQGDAYGGGANSGFSWQASDSSFPAGPHTVRFTIREVNDVDPSAGREVLQVVRPGLVVDSESELFLTLTSAETNSIGQTTPSATYNYDVEIEYGPDSYRTIAVGRITVLLPQTRRSRLANSAIGAFDTPVTFDALANDPLGDFPFDPSTLAENSSPNNGMVVYNADGTLVYTPDSGFSGLDVFDYSILDTNGTKVIVTVTINVTGEECPAITVTSVADKLNVSYNLNISVDNIDDQELTLCLFDEDDEQIADLGAVTAGVTTVDLLALYQNSNIGLQNIRARIKHPTCGFISETLLNKLPPSGPVLFPNVTGNPTSGETSDMEINGVKIGTATVSAGNLAVTGIAGNLNINTSTTVGNPLVINFQMDSLFDRYTLLPRDIDGILSVQDATIVENVTTPGDTITVTDPSPSMNFSGNTSPLTITTSDETNENNTSLMVSGGVTDNLVVTHFMNDQNNSGDTTIAGSIQYRLDLFCD